MALNRTRGRVIGLGESKPLTPPFFCTGNQLESGAGLPFLATGIARVWLAIEAGVRLKMKLRKVGCV